MTDVMTSDYSADTNNYAGVNEVHSEVPQNIPPSAGYSDISDDATHYDSDSDDSDSSCVIINSDNDYEHDGSIVPFEGELSTLKLSVQLNIVYVNGTYYILNTSTAMDYYNC